MKNRYNLIASIGLIIGAVFGIAGGMLTDAHMQACAYEISSIGLIYASAMLCILYLRQSQDVLAAGWLLMCIGEAAMSTGTGGGQPFSQPMFAAGMGIYLPALLMISIPAVYPLWSRISGLIAAGLFTITAGLIYSGTEVLSTHTLPTMAYTLLTIGMIGYIMTLLKKDSSK